MSENQMYRNGTLARNAVKRNVVTLLHNTRNPANIYWFKANNRYTRKRYEIYSKLTLKAPEQSH